MVNILKIFTSSRKKSVVKNIKKKVKGIKKAQGRKVVSKKPRNTKKSQKRKISLNPELIDDVSNDYLENRTNQDFSLKDMIKRCDYPPIELEKDDKKKIKKLKNIVKSIDEKPNPKNSFKSSKKHTIDYRGQLNPAQLAAVSLKNYPLLVIAGAGSGKTRVIVYKVAYLIESGVTPSEVLLLTFTKKAASEMLDRVTELLGEKSVNGVLGGTFHSFSNHALRKYGKLVGIPQNFTIVDTQDASDILSLLKNEHSDALFLNEKERKVFPNKRMLQDIISKSRNTQTPISYILSEHFPAYTECAQKIKDINKLFETYKKAHNIFDYDDLMEVLRDKLRDNETFRKSIKKNIKYILVDEYQDTNNVQREIVELLAGDGKGLTVVGDDAQSIYSFRGANFENILFFPKSFPNCRWVKIEENYRSGQEILDFTNEIISNSQIGFKKKLRTKKCIGTKPIMKTFSDQTEEAKYIADKILEIRNDTMEYSNFAVLTRASWHSNIIQAEFAKRGFPFVVFGGIKFSERRHVKDVISFLKILLNPVDAVAWHRILKLIDGVGNVRATEIVREIKEQNGVIKFTSFKKKPWYKGLHQYEKFYERKNESILPAEAIETVIVFYKNLLKNAEPEDYKIRMKDIDTLITIASKYSDLEKFLSDFTLEPPTNKWQDNVMPTEPREKPVVVSTIHSAKGLEWHTVFMPHVLDGLIPSSRSIGSLEEVEEERRLFYVAASRAMENLFITMPCYVYGFDAIFTKPSRFLKEVGKKCYEIEE